MEQLDVVDSINNAGNWLVRNQALLLSYAVNIVAAIAIIIVGMIVARIVSNTVNRVMLARHIDATVADFLSALVRYGIIAFTLIAALGRVGVQTASVIAVLGAAGLAIGLALQGSLSNLAALPEPCCRCRFSQRLCVPSMAASWSCRTGKLSRATSSTSPVSRCVVTN